MQIEVRGIISRAHQRYISEVERRANENVLNEANKVPDKNTHETIYKDDRPQSKSSTFSNLIKIISNSNRTNTKV